MSRNAWNRHWGCFMVDMVVLSNNMKFPSHESWHSVGWPYTQWQPSTDQAIYRIVTILPNSTFYQIMTGHLRLMLHADRERSFPYTLHLFYLFRPILFPNLYFYRTMHYKHPLALSQFCSKRPNPTSLITPCIRYHWPIIQSSRVQFLFMFFLTSQSDNDILVIYM